jgi:hypothetical protein
MAYRTLGALRSLVLARLGMGAMGASGGAAGTLIDSFLSNGQMQLYRAQDWRFLTDYKDITTGVSQNLYDYPTTGTMLTDRGCDRDRRILRLETIQSGQYDRMTEGITTSDWSNMETVGSPAKFERYAQLLVYPKGVNATDTIRVWYVADLMPFTVDDDVATLDDEMVLLHAVTNAKAHYRQPDAKLYEGQLNTLLASLRGQTFSTDGVYRRGTPVSAERRPISTGVP